MKKPNIMEKTKKKARLFSFSCKNIKSSVDCVRTLCQQADVIALQETWLYPYDISFLDGIHNDFSYTGKSAIDISKGILRGRPHGGVAILWRKDLFSSVSVLQCVSDRLTAIKVRMSDREVIIICVYMPTDSTENFVDFCECMSEIAAIVENSNVESCYILGDFNAHPGEPFYKDMYNYCSDNQWICA